ncbi:MAG TPA: FAD-dependent oxidoreductase [Solirubrobacteraceae bacterium]|nr:FAD-dependent oxidoreductase [Solirubrobacteraceae bacterium]
MRRSDVLIAGAGIGAVRTAQGLRDAGFEGTVRLIGEERRLPYDRPPLSKDYLLGRRSEQDIRLLDTESARKLGVDLVLGRPLESLDPVARRVRDATGAQFGYDRLVVATGARPRRLPLLEGRRNVHYLRTLDDADAMRTAFAERPRVGIVGAGFIGLEIASAARTLGCEVTVIEGADAPLAMVLGEQVGRWVQGWHEDHGVAFHCGAPLRVAHGGDSVEALVLEDGTRVPVDVVVVGVGVDPDTGWLAGSGLELHRGLVCDAAGTSSDPHVFGVGDVACRHVDGRCIWAAHWTPASEQAQLAAATIAGDARPPRSLEAYFWSDQFGVRLQFAGIVEPGAPVRVTSGAVEDRRFVAEFGDDRKPTGVFAMDLMRDFLRARLALRAGERAGSPAP